MLSDDDMSLTVLLLAPTKYRENIHEGEYVSIPSRNPLPISTRSLRIDSPASFAELDVEDPKSPSPEEEPTVPTLVHKWSHTHSILCVVPAPSKKLVFCGTQDSKILVYDIENYNLKLVVNCSHEEYHNSILALTLTEDESFLFSAGSDSLVRVWDLQHLNNLLPVTELTCTHVIYLLVDIGDIFSLSWSSQLSTLFIGVQNASLLWCHLPLGASVEPSPKLDDSTLERLPHFRFDKFFDSKGPGGSINVLQSQHQQLRQVTKRNQLTLVEVKPTDIVRFAHNGYVYCMQLVSTSGSDAEFTCAYTKYSEILISCGGDGIICIWGVANTDGIVSITKLETLENEELVLSMSIQDSYLYVGLSNSTINMWDLMTLQLIRSFHFLPASEASSYDEVLSLSIFNGCIFKASNLGGLIKFTLKSHVPTLLPGTNGRSPSLHLSHYVSPEDDQYNSLFNKSHNSVLAVNIFHANGHTFLLSGGLKSLCLWDISNVGSPSKTLSTKKSFESLGELSNQHLLSSLKSFIAYKTISKYPHLYLEESRHCAQFLSKLFITLGASHTKLLPVSNANPVVYSHFSSNHPNVTKPTRVLWYAHYDVVEVSARNSWNTDPFHLTARDGNLYARGVSDNKGPILAAMYAVAELHRKNELSCDVVFVIEGEEECGSIGFQDVITKNKDLIGPIDWVMLSNSYWLDDETPCLNYGLRGVLNASVTVQSAKPDRHSGVDGGVSKEPTMDLVQILNDLQDRKTNRIRLPGFYDDVLPLTKTELHIYKKIEEFAASNNINDQDIKTLIAKWRNPSLTVHKIQVSGPNNNTVIPQTAKASISIRVVPNQDLAKIKRSVVEYLHQLFDELDSDNTLSVDIFHEAEPWLGDPSNLVYQILYEKIRANWGSGTPEPLLIREGGSIPSIRFLEKCFDAPAAQIPCGQLSDNAHLMNEKLRIMNLYKLRDILTDTLRELGLERTAKSDWLSGQ